MTSAAKLREVTRAGKDSPLVSVLIRSAAAITLQRTLDSVAQQDYAALEILVVAASGAGHPPLPATWNERPLRLITSDEPLSRSSATNRLLDAASGDYVAIMDDDDQWRPWHLSTMVKTLQSTPIARLAYSMAVIRDQAGVESGTVGVRAHPLTFAEQMPFAMHTALIRRELIADSAVARFDETLEALEDLDFLIACATLTPLAFVPEITAICNSVRNESGQESKANASPHSRERALVRIREKWMAQFTSWQAQPLGQVDLAALYAQRGDGRRAELMLQIASRNEWHDQALLNRFLQLCRELGLVHDDATETVAPTDRVVEVSIAASTKAMTGQNAKRMSLAGAVKKSPAR